MAAIVDEYFSGQRAHRIASVRKITLVTMPFSFSFRFAVPGLSNPFASQSVFTSSLGPRARPEPKPEPVDGDSSWVVPAPAYPHHHHLSPTPSSSRGSSSPTSNSRKRGWVPSTSEPSQAAIMTTATSGFLDTPSKYRDLVDSQDSLDEVVVGELHISTLYYFVLFVMSITSLHSTFVLLYSLRPPHESHPADSCALARVFLVSRLFFRFTFQVIN